MAAQSTSPSSLGSLFTHKLMRSLRPTVHPSVHSRVTGSAAHGLGPPESGVGGKRVLEPLEGLEVETGALEGAALYPQKSPNGAVGDVAEP